MTGPNDAAGAAPADNPDGGSATADIVRDAESGTTRSQAGDATTAGGDATQNGSHPAPAIDPKNFPEQYRDALLAQPAEVQEWAEGLRKDVLKGLYQSQEKYATERKNLSRYAEIGKEFEKYQSDPDFLEWKAARLRGPAPTPDPNAIPDDLDFTELETEKFTPTLKAWFQQQLDSRLDQVRTEERQRYEQLVEEKINNSEPSRERRTTRALDNFYAKIQGTTPLPVFRDAVLAFKGYQLQEHGKQLTDFKPDDLIGRLAPYVEHFRYKHMHDSANPGTAPGTRAPSPSPTNAGGASAPRLPWQDADGNDVREPTKAEQLEHIGTPLSEIAAKYPEMFG